MPSTLIDVAPAYQVTRPFTALGRELQRGEIVDCAGWRNVQPLINSRYLKPMWTHIWPDNTGTADAPAPVAAPETSPDQPPVHRGPGRPRKDAA